MALANPFDFAGKTVILAGATGGLGRPIAAAFSEAGANLAMCARGEEVLPYQFFVQRAACTVSRAI